MSKIELVENATPGNKGYANPPIVRAVLDIRLVRDEPYNIEALKGITRILAEDFPQFREAFNDTLRGSVDSPMRHERETMGLQLYNPVSGCLLHIVDDGFVLSQEGIYPGWGELQRLAARCVDAYLALFPDAAYSRLGLRYINQLVVPTPCELSQFLRAYPQLPENMSTGMGGFEMRVAFNLEDERYGVILNQGVLPKPSEDLGAILLDIDVYSLIPGLLSETPALWNAFSEMRTIKNRVFEQSITEEMRELIR